jgi:hypothetical protein
VVGRPEGKRPLGRPRCRWEDNIKIDLTGIGIDGANWVHLANEPLGAIKQDFFDKLSDNQLFK